MGEGAGISSESVVNVLVEPPGPFAYLPDQLLEATGNAVVHAALVSLQVSYPQRLELTIEPISC